MSSTVHTYLFNICILYFVLPYFHCYVSIWLRLKSEQDSGKYHDFIERNRSDAIGDKMNAMQKKGDSEKLVREMLTKEGIA